MCLARPTPFVDFVVTMLPPCSRCVMLKGKSADEVEWSTVTWAKYYMECLRYAQAFSGILVKSIVACRSYHVYLFSGGRVFDAKVKVCSKHTSKKEGCTMLELSLFILTHESLVDMPYQVRYCRLSRKNIRVVRVENLRVKIPLLVSVRIFGDFVGNFWGVFLRYLRK